MLDYSKNLTARLYQNGLSREDSLNKGANAIEFDALEAKYKGGSIPLDEYLGCKFSPSYSCAYHAGGAKGELLRNICKGQK